MGLKAPNKFFFPMYVMFFFFDITFFCSLSRVRGDTGGRTGGGTGGRTRGGGRGGGVGGEGFRWHRSHDLIYKYTLYSCYRTTKKQSKKTKKTEKKKKNKIAKKKTRHPDEANPFGDDPS